MPTTTRKLSPRERIELAQQARREQGPNIHLWRGAPATRTWSRYQDTVQAWSVCGVALPENAPANADECNCPYYLQLLANPRRP